MPMHRHAAVGGVDHRAHDRRARRHRAGAQIVAVGKAAGNADEVDAVRKLGLAVPDHRRRAAGDLLQRDGDVAVAIGAGEDDDGAFHAVSMLLDPEILDHRVGEQLAAHLLDLGVARAVGEVELDQLAGADVLDAGEAEPSSAWWMALPCGSRTPGFRVMNTRAFMSPCLIWECGALWPDRPEGQALHYSLPCSCGCSSHPRCDQAVGGGSLMVGIAIAMFIACLAGVGDTSAGAIRTERSSSRSRPASSLGVIGGFKAKG